MDKKPTPIWDELSAIGEAAPAGTWDNVPTNLSMITVSVESEIFKQLQKQAAEENAENERLRAENEALKLAHARYECVRRLSPRAFTELWKANVMRNEGSFDDLVDRLIKNHPLGDLPK